MTVAAPRRLLVDARPLDHPTARQRGIGRYVTGLLRGLADIDAPAVAMVGSAREAAMVADAAPGIEIDTLCRSTIRRRASADTWFVATQLMLHPISLDPIPSCVTEARLPVAAVMYDVIPYRYPELYLDRPAPRRQAPLRAALARTLDLVLAISRFAAETSCDALALDPARIEVIGAGVDDRFRRPSEDPRRVVASIVPDADEPYVVSVTGADERKNTRGLLAAWGRLPAAVRDRHRLVIAAGAPAPLLAEWQAAARSAGCSDRVTFAGAVSDAEMVALLQGARLAVVPSLEEGFGLPVVEAAACGAPVICSDVSSLPDVLDEPAACFDPRDPHSIATAIERALTDDAHRAVLFGAGERAVRRWRWDETARRVVRAVANGRPRRPPPRAPRVRLALAGPFEESASPIGAVDAAVVEALGRATDAEIVRLVDVSCSSASTRPAWDRYPAGAAPSLLKAHEFDHVTVVLGNAADHVAAERLARAHPCHVWLHDSSLVALHLGLAALSGSPEWSVRHMSERVTASHGEELLATIAAGGDGGLLDADRYAACGARLLDETLRAARSVIVHDEDMLHAALAATGGRCPVLVVPLPSSAQAGGGWTFDDLAAALLSWWDSVDALGAGTVHRAGLPAA